MISAEIFSTGAASSPCPTRPSRPLATSSVPVRPAQIPFEYHLALERELQAALFNSSDAKEGIAAYVEKRVANFTGE